MSKRSDRREAERQTRKLACLALRNQSASAAAEPAEVASDPTPTQPVAIKISEAQLAANRANAKLSTGPSSFTGKAAASRNALKTGLTGRTVLLPGDDTAEYQSRLDHAITHHRPANEEEHKLVQSLVDTDWRLDRAVSLETGIYAKGAAEFADKFDDQPLAHRKLLIQTETYLKYEKSLRNLNVQEARLQRQRTRVLAELKRLKDERGRHQLLLQTARKLNSAPRPSAPSPLENGFEFSTPDIAPEIPPAFTADALNTAEAHA